VDALFAATGRPFSVRTTRTSHGVARSICVKADSPLFASVDIDYRYGRGVQYGKASLFLSVGPPLAVTVTADPASIDLGDTSQLVARVHGGVPPYFYSWVPSTGLDDTDIAAPIARPLTTTEYRVLVTDSIGQQEVAGASIHVFARLGLTVEAVPEEINAGDVAVLVAQVSGGTPPYTYTWTPTDTLEDDPSSPHPSALPATTTTYQVMVVDSEGFTSFGSVTVKVRMQVEATAQPQEIIAGETAALFVEVRGGTPPYTFTWTPAGRLDDPHRKDPIAAPTIPTTYQVIARDAAGDAAGGAVTVSVVGDGPPPSASFGFTVVCCPTLMLDAGASTGDIVTYAWDLGWTSANPDRITSSPTTSFNIQEFDRGPITLTVTAADGQVATVMRNF
jgi:hypothetical protein